MLPPKKAPVLEAASLKAERRKSQPAHEREPYTAAEVRALIAHAYATVRKERGPRAARSKANKAAWAAGGGN